MPELTDQTEIDAYYLADPMRPRAAGVMWPTLVEHRIDKLFEIALRPDKKVHNELFQASGALGNYAVKVRLAYMLGWISEQIFDDLIRIAKIRNRCAHAIEAKDFKDQAISAVLTAMTVYNFIPGMLERAKEAEKKDPSAKNKASVLILHGMREDPVSAFRFCIDMMIHKLDEIGKNMEENLRKLPGHWMVTKNVKLPHEMTDETKK